MDPRRFIGHQKVLILKIIGITNFDITNLIYHNARG